MTMHFHEYTLRNIGAGVAVARILGECPVGPAHSNCKFATVNAYEWTDTVLRTSVEEDSADHTHTIAVVDIVTGTGDITAPSTLTTCGRGHANCYCSAATTKRLATAVELNEEATTGAAGSGTHRHTYVSRAAQIGLYYKVSDGQCPSGHDDCLAESIGTKNLIGQNGQNYYTEYNTPGVIHPSDDVARVSSIRRIYHPGLYRMEVALGDLGFEWDVSEVGMRKIPDEVEEPEAPGEEPSVVPQGEPLTEADWAEIIKQQQASDWYKQMTAPPPTVSTHTTALAQMPTWMPPPSGKTTPISNKKKFTVTLANGSVTTIQADNLATAKWLAQESYGRWGIKVISVVEG